MRLALLPFLIAASASASSLHTTSKNVGTALLPRKQRNAFQTTTTRTVPQKLTEKENNEIFTQLRAGGQPLLAPKDALLGAVFFTVADILFRKAFKAANIAFPSQLAGCMIIFASLVSINVFVCPNFADALFKMLSPGADLLTKWMPVFFVPGLAMLPLAPSVGSSLEAIKAISTVIVGVFFSMVTTVYAVEAVTKLIGIEEPAPTDSVKETGPAPPRPPPFTADTFKRLLAGSALSGAVSIGATKSDHKYANLLQTVFMMFSTVAAYVFGARLPPAFTKIVHPLWTSTAVTLGVTKALSAINGDTFINVLKSYKSGSLGLSTVGAGDILLFLLGPSVVAFAAAMYSRKDVMKDNALVIGTGVLMSSAGGLFGTALYVRLIAIANNAIRLSLLCRNVTTALAIPIIEILGGNIAIGVSAVVLTGIFGATVGRATLDKMGIKSPVTRGLGMGASAQALGVTAMSSEVDAFPFAALSMVLTAVCATCLVSIPVVKDTLVNIAVGAVQEVAEVATEL